MPVSFYDLDYIIELNLKRLEEYNASLQKVLDRFPNIILIYSGLGIFLISLIQHLIDADIKGWLFYLIFAIFALALLTSLCYFVKLLLPAKIAYLDPPEKYYKDYRIQIESDYPSDKKKVDESLKGSYILEIENAIAVNYQVFRQKSSFYYNALAFALITVIPYIMCIGYHLSKKEEKAQKVELVRKKM